MKVLVTGAGGMVGSHMVELLHDQGHEVLGTYYKPTTDITELDPDIRMEECDVRYYQQFSVWFQNFSRIKFTILQRKVIRQFLGLIRRQQWKQT